MEMTKNLDPIFKPNSIAIIGASNNPNKIGGRPIKFLKKYKFLGDIYPVNPKYDVIQDVKCYSSLFEIPKNIDLAVIALPANYVLPALKNCKERGVKSVVIFSSGFAEMGGEGKKLQDEINKIGQESGMLVCGPNTVGVINVPMGVGATMSQILEQDVSSAPLALISQSGAYGTFIAALAKEMGLGFNYFLSTGNESNLEFADYVNYFLEKEDVKIIAGYIEGIRDGEKLKMAAKRAVQKKKPIVAIKVGRSEVGSKAASSHTGSLTGADNIYDSFFKQYGILRVDNEQSLLNVVTTLNNGVLPSGRNVGILSMSGGAGIQMADECEENGLKIAQFDQETIRKLKNVIPEFGSAQNPVDLTAQFLADPQLLTDSLRIMTEDKNVDLIVFFLGLGWSFGDKIADELIKVASETDKPIAISWVAGPEKVITKLRENGINVFPGISEAMQTMAHVTNYKEFLDSQEAEADFDSMAERDLEVKEIFQNAVKNKRDSLTESEAKSVFGKYGIPVTNVKLVKSEAEAIEVGNAIGYPVVAKIESTDIKHKSEAKAVKLNIQSEQELIKSYHEVLKNALDYNPNANINGVIIEEMLEKGKEVIVGVTHDPQFGPVIMFGMGGVFVEVFKDVSFRIAPISKNEARKMIMETKSYQILQGTRGEKPSDIDSIVDILVNISRLSVDLKEYISEIDINPLIVYEQGKGVKAADALIVLSESKKEAVSHGI